MKRIEREKKVVSQMIAIYCRKHHSAPSGALCGKCSELLDYAHKRLSCCPKGEAKTSCRKCDVHCYSASRREAIREVMRYVGPRMLLIHPLAAIRHLIDEMR